jgi:hypothetical protein
MTLRKANWRVEPKTDTPVGVAKKIGREYVEREQLPHEGTEYTASVYASVADRICELYDSIPVPVVFQSDDPYTDYADMAETVGQEQQLRVYDQHTDHPHFSESEQLKFRAVHDWHGHLSADVDFSPAGEFTKWAHMTRYFGPTSNRVMLAEVVGQVGAVHYLQDGFADERYEQRAFLAPTRWSDWMADAVYAVEL